MKYRSGLLSLMQLIFLLPKRTWQLNFYSLFLKSYIQIAVFQKVKLFTLFFAHFCHSHAVYL